VILPAGSRDAQRAPSTDSDNTDNASIAPRPRLEWLDIGRGVALIAMASYHFTWDLADFGYIDSAFPSTGWPKIYARAIASTFLFLAGLSLVLAHGNGIRWASFRIRLAKIAAAALLVTVATYFAMPQGFIFFGILHAIAAASLIGLIFLRVPWLVTALVAAAAIAAPNYLRSEIFDPPWLWWVGLSTWTRLSFDYVPLLPWLGPFLFGMAFGRLGIIQNRLRQNAGGITARKWPGTLFTFLGRHSLVFYLIHQPILIALLYGFSLLVPAPQVAPETTFIQECEMECKTRQDADLCHRYCGCTLERIQQANLPIPFQSRAISEEDISRIREFAVECTTMSQ
jgi:uncharacterized membrane protein